jgi:excinuclease UvrABC nuclease subunit
MHLDKMKRFELNAIEAQVLEGNFRLLMSGLDLRNLDKVTCMSSLPVQSGCYFWIMRSDSRRYKIYIGRTRSILKRVMDYANAFQVHSPNDYKLRFFQESMSQAFPTTALDLYFTDVPVEQCKARETELVRQFSPLINTLPPPTDHERDRIRGAFEEYYRSSTTRHLGG